MVNSMKSHLKKHVQRVLRHTAQSAGAFAVTLMTSVGIGHAADVPFDGSVDQTCTIQIIQTGILVSTDNGRRLRSNVSAARNALVRVTTNTTGFEVTADQPTSFDTEPTDDVSSAETFAAALRGRTNTIFEWRPSNGLNVGTTDIRVRLLVTKVVPSDAFAAGSYAATVPVRCD